MRFAGQLIEQYTGDAQMSPGGIGSRERFHRMLQEPRAPFSLDPSTLELTPEMAPRPYYPGQDLMRDKYIKLDPRSGIT